MFENLNLCIKILKLMILQYLLLISLKLLSKKFLDYILKNYLFKKFYIFHKLNKNKIEIKNKLKLTWFELNDKKHIDILIINI